jgi:hypothetical protein
MDTEEPSVELDTSGFPINDAEEEEVASGGGGGGSGGGSAGTRKSEFLSSVDRVVLLAGLPSPESGRFIGTLSECLTSAKRTQVCFRLAD